MLHGGIATPWSRRHSRRWADPAPFPPNLPAAARPAGRAALPGRRPALERILAFAGERGWRRLRLLSSAGNAYNRDYLAETADGAQQPMLNVLHRDGDTIRHFWGSELFCAPADPGQEPRHVGTLEPVWNLCDLTPEGRGTDWDEQLSYWRLQPGPPSNA